MRTWILQRFQVYARVCLVTAVSLSPLAFHRSTADVFNLVKITVLWMLGISALVLCISWCAERRRWLPRFNLLYAAGAFLFVCALATIFSDNPAVSLIGLYHRYGGLLPLILYATFMVLIVALYWERPSELREIPWGISAAAFLMSVYVLIQAAGLDWIDWREASGRKPEFPVGTMGNSNFAGGYLGLAAPFCAYTVISARERWQYLLTALLGVELISVWFTQSRGGMIAAASGILTMIFLYRKRLPFWINVGGAGALGVVAIVAVFVIWHPGTAAPPGPLAEMKTFRTGTLQIRGWYWSAALRIFFDHPILGTGLESFYANYPRYRLHEDGAQLGLTITDKPHNIYLEYAANTGILGLASYLVLIGLGTWYGYRKCRELTGGPQMLLVGFVGTLAGYMAQGVFSIDVPPLAAMGWLALGGIAAIADPGVVRTRAQAQEEAKQRTERGMRGNRSRRGGRGARSRQRSQIPALPLRWPVHLASASLAAALVVVGARPVTADVRVKAAQTRTQQKAPPEEIDRFYQQAISMNPIESSYRVARGFAAERQAEGLPDRAAKERTYRDALANYQKAATLQPNNLFYAINIARLYAAWGRALDPERFRDADRTWRRVIETDQSNWEARRAYGQMLMVWGSSTLDASIFRRAIDMLKISAGLREDQAETWLLLGKAHFALRENEKARQALRKALSLDPNLSEASTLLSQALQ